jgi:hypothetical protein
VVVQVPCSGDNTSKAPVRELPLRAREIWYWDDLTPLSLLGTLTSYENGPQAILTIEALSPSEFTEHKKAPHTSGMSTLTTTGCDQPYTRNARQPRKRHIRTHSIKPALSVVMQHVLVPGA